jgi:ADP-heptose:LPS heptosyltransferase
VKNFLQNKWIQVKIFMYIRKINPAFLINLSPRATGISELRDLIFFKFLCGIKKYNYLRADDGERDLSEKSSHPIPEWRRLLNIATKNNLNAKFNLTIPLWADFEASKLLSGITVDDNELIAICPGSKMPSKRWPLDRYIELGRRILAENAFTRIVILGGVEDSLAGDKMVSELGPRVVNLAGVSTLFGSAGVLKKCKCYIGNDTGTMHLAAFLGVSCLALFSDRDEIGKWDPYGSGHIILRKTVECSGCMLEICNQDNRCLKAITVNDAHQAWIRMRESSNLPKTLKTN